MSLDLSTLEDEPDYSQSLFIDENELKTNDLTSIDRLGDTFTGVPGRLIGKSAFYL